MRQKDTGRCGILFFTAVFMAAIVFAGCGKGESKEVDTLATGVLKLTITPAPTSTPAPEMQYPDAVVSRDGITMVNSFLADASEGKNPYAGMAAKINAETASSSRESDGGKEDYYDYDTGYDDSY